MNKKFWITLLTLLAFMFFIQIIYNLWFARTTDEEPMQQIRQAESGMVELMEHLESAGVTIDSAITGLEQGMTEIGRLREQVLDEDSAYKLSLINAGQHIEVLMSSFRQERESLDSLRMELMKLK